MLYSANANFNFCGNLYGKKGKEFAHKFMLDFFGKRIHAAGCKRKEYCYAVTHKGTDYAPALGRKDFPYLFVNRAAVVGSRVGNFKAGKEVVAVRNSKVVKVVGKVRVAVVKDAGIDKVAFHHGRDNVKLLVQLYGIRLLSALIVHCIHCVAYRLDYKVSVNRLCKVLERPHVECLLGILEFVVGSKYYYDDVGVHLLYKAYCFKSAYSGHAYVHKKNVYVLGAHFFQCLCTGVCGKNLYLLGKVFVQNHGKRICHNFFVIGQ